MTGTMGWGATGGRGAGATSGMARRDWDVPRKRPRLGVSERWRVSVERRGKDCSFKDVAMVGSMREERRESVMTELGRCIAKDNIYSSSKRKRKN